MYYSPQAFVSCQDTYQETIVLSMMLIHTDGTRSTAMIQPRRMWRMCGAKKGVVWMDYSSAVGHPTHRTKLLILHEAPVG